MLFSILFTIIFFVIIVLFSFPQFSPIPYFPSNKKDLPFIIQSLRLKNKQVVFDLGAGDGMVIFAGAKEAFRKKLDTQFVAVEINPVLLSILYIRKLLHPNRRNIKVMYGNMFTMNYKKHLTLEFSHLTFYLYISPWYLARTVSNLKSQISNFNVVSYMYEIPYLKPSKKIEADTHPVFIYTI